jgi:c-di-GMP-binding flagellar brake protein YcgR
MGGCGRGANFVLSKPLQGTRWRGVVETVIPKMQREHRRYFRHKVGLPLRLADQVGQTLSARLKNISEGGMAIELADPLRLEGGLRKRPSGMAMLSGGATSVP